MTIYMPTMTIATSPSGRTVTIDGNACTAPCGVQWIPGTTHTIAVSSPQAGGSGTQYAFYGWSDGGNASHSVTASTSAATYTATFTTQYYLSTAIGTAGGGSISPGTPGAWYNSGASVSVGASAGTGFTFTGFSGALSGTTSPQSVTMNSAKSVTATFRVQSAGFQYGRALTIDHTKVPNTDQSNFPVLVYLSDATLRDNAHGGHVMSASGYDICFYGDAAGNTPLSWEVEGYDNVNGVLRAWVKVPTVSHTTDTMFYVFYGNSAVTAFQSTASSAWDSSFKGVWHLPNGTTLTANDSTTNAYNGTTGSTAAATGKIGGGASFNGSSNQIGFATSGYTVTGSFTFGAWVKPGSTKWADGIAGSRSSTGGFDVKLSSGNQIHADIGTSSGWLTTSADASFSYSAGTWYHIVYVVSGTGYTIYANGSSVGSGSYSSATPVLADSAHTLRFGETGISSEWWDGSLDEVRISSAARSGDWIATEYANQNSPSTFFVVGPENSPATAGVTDFTLSATPATATAARSGGASYIVTVNGTGGFNGTVTFAGTGVNDLPATFSPATVTGSGSTTMTVYPASTAALTTSNLTVTGTSGSVTRTAVVSGSTLPSLTVVSSAPYAYYQSDGLTSINSSNWWQNGTVTTSGNGLTGGVVISKLTASTGNDYDEQVTVTNCGTGFQRAITLYARSTSDAQTAYLLRLDTTYSWATFSKKISGYVTDIGSFPMACSNGLVLRMVVRGNNILIWQGAQKTVFTDSSISSGQPGVGVTGGASVNGVQFGAVETVAPPAVNQAGLKATAAPYWVDLQWPAGSGQCGRQRAGGVRGVARQRAPGLHGHSAVA